MKKVLAVLIATALGLSSVTGFAAGEVSSAPPGAVSAQKSVSKPNAKPVKKAPAQKAQSSKKKHKKHLFH